MTLNKSFLFSLVGVASGVWIGCGQTTPRVDVRTDNGISRIIAGGALIHETSGDVRSLDVIPAGEGLQAVLWQERQNGVERSLYSVYESSVGWVSAREAHYEIALRDGTFRPDSSDDDDIDAPVQGLSIVQFKTQPLASYRSALNDGGIEILDYIHSQAYLVKGSPAALASLRALPFVRWVGPFSVEHKLDSSLKAQLATNDGPTKLVLVPTKPDALPGVLAAVMNAGGKVLSASARGMVVEAYIDLSRVPALAASDDVAWLEVASGISVDMDNARIQGGADYMRSLPEAGLLGYSGLGIRGHIMEGIDANHPDFAATPQREKPIAVDAPASTSHGQSTFGIVFGSGAGNAKGKGILFNGQGYYTNYDFVYNGDPTQSTRGTRYELVGRLVKDQKIMFETASWGYDRTLDYGARSAEMDRLIFDHDIPITQSQSNACSKDSRPQAWAKNIISVGAVYHYDNINPLDDKWKGDSFSCASIGPAKDGRIKPDLVAYYDEIFTTGMGTSYTTFGGTSGATPIVAGYLGLTLEAYTNGLFKQLSHPLEQRFENRPHFTTAKALMINTAAQYAFQGAEHDLTRTHQGWGFPSMKNMHGLRDKMLVVDEEVVLKNLESKSFDIKVKDGEPELKVTMTYADPVGNLANARNRVNDLDLKVTAPDGSVYWGNAGLLVGNFSTVGGAADKIDTVENVFIKAPAAGTWKIEVIAAELVADGHSVTPELDSAFALIASGIEK